jgi:hypothetical protein
MKMPLLLIVCQRRAKVLQLVQFLFLSWLPSSLLLLL